MTDGMFIHSHRRQSYRRKSHLKASASVVNQDQIKTFHFLETETRQSFSSIDSTHFAHFVQTEQIETFGIDGEIHGNGILRINREIGSVAECIAHCRLVRFFGPFQRERLRTEVRRDLVGFQCEELRVRHF